MTETPQDRCRRYRLRILEISRQVAAAHVAPAFSCLEIVDCLYHEVMRPDDIFIMSKGHGCLAQYVVLEDLKWEPARDVTEPRLLDSYCQPGGTLGAHPDYAPRLGIHASTGSLGHGLGIAVGQALAEQLKGSSVEVYCLLSDGECQEGSTWEAAMVAANLGLRNLKILVDANGWGGMDQMAEVHPQASLFSLRAKFEAFGWAADAVDGHNHFLIRDTLRSPLFRPQAVMCRTTKGRGVSFMEDAPIWHYRSPTPEEYAQAMSELS